MTRGELSDYTTDAMREAFGELGTDGRRPYGLSIAEANAAMLEGVLRFVSEVIMHSTRPTEESRGFAAQWACETIVSRVEALQTAGSA